MKNKYKIIGDTVCISVKFKGSVLTALIDVIDFSIADSFKGTWSCSQYHDKPTVYVTATDHNGGNRKSLKLHRLITDAPNDKIVDHINGNGLDNRRKNLRICNYAENNQNQRLSRRNTSGFRGVSYKRDRRKWKAYLSIDGKQHHIGYFDSAEEAHEAVKVHRAKMMPFSREAGE